VPCTERSLAPVPATRRQPTCPRPASSTRAARCRRSGNFPSGRSVRGDDHDAGIGRRPFGWRNDDRPRCSHRCRCPAMLDNPSGSPCRQRATIPIWRRWSSRTRWSSNQGGRATGTGIGLQRRWVCASAGLIAHDMTPVTTAPRVWCADGGGRDDQEI
jgi:hypothetical protein